jgi:hypothetical protein
MLQRNTSLRVSLGMPPLVLDEWRRITSGYEVIGAEGVREVPKNAPVATQYAVALAALKRTVADPRVELLDVPFADPDLSGLMSIEAMSDLSLHYDLGEAVYQASIGATPSAGTDVAGGEIPQSAVPSLMKQRIRHIVVWPSSLDSSPAAGMVTVAHTPMRAVVLDREASAILSDRNQPTQALLDRVFERMTSKAASHPLAMEVRLGPGAGTEVASLEPVLVELARSGLVRFITAAEATRLKPASGPGLRLTVDAGPPAPKGYWPEVANGRRDAIAFMGALRGLPIGRCLRQAQLREY